MSAAPVVPLRPPEPHPTGIKGHMVRIRSAYLAMFRQMSQCEIGCLTLIIVESIGWGKLGGYTRRSLKLSDFAEHCNQEQRSCQKALANLELEYNLITRTKAGRGYEYKLVARIDIDGSDAFGNCPDCKKTTPFTLDRDILIPHSLFLNVQQSVDRGSLLCILLISLETMRWKDGQIWIHPVELKVEEFCRRTGLNKSEVESDLKKAEARGFIGSSGRRGGVQTYWPIPNSWPLAGVRSKRTGGNPSPGRRKESEQEIHSVPQPIETKQKSSPVQFWCKPCGTCHECQYFGPVEIVPGPEIPVRKPIGHARDGPPPQPLSKLPTFQRDNWKKEA